MGEGWGTWEELILGAAVLRHGTTDWNVVVSELQSRTLQPLLFTVETCKAKYEELRKRCFGSMNWFEVLKQQRVAELKQILAKFEISIGSLESKIKTLEAERLSNSDSDASRWLDKHASNDDNSAGSRTIEMMDAETSPNASTSCDRHHKDLSIGIQGVTVKKKRGLRRRKNHNSGIEGRGENERNKLLSDILSSTTLQETSAVDGEDTTVNSDNPKCGGGSTSLRRNNLIDTYEAISSSKPAMVFRHRMDSQKRARYRKMIKQHMDMGSIRSKLVEESITSAKQLFHDLLLLANNGVVFYSSETREHKSAVALRSLIMKEYKQHCGG